MRSIVALLALLLSAGAFQQATAASAERSTPWMQRDPPPDLRVTIKLDRITAPRHLQTKALLYRLEYRTPVHLLAYTRTRWAAAPSELFARRLRARLTSRQGITRARLPGASNAYHLNMTLEDFAQDFASPEKSQCLVRLTATVTDDAGQSLARRTFNAQRPAPTADAAGAIEGLVDASDGALDQILIWLRTLTVAPPLMAARHGS